MTDPLAHGMFTLERRYEASPARVFRAWSDPDAFRRWFVESPGATILDWRHDLRVGAHGGGRYRFGGPGTPVGFNETVFLDLVENSRIILAYVMGHEMAEERRRESASLATIELFVDGGGTRLIYTEQGTYYGEDGGDHLPLRKEGCAEMLENLARELETRP